MLSIPACEHLLTIAYIIKVFGLRFKPCQADHVLGLCILVFLGLIQGVVGRTISHEASGRFAGSPADRH